jgi:D-arabinose 1-dehydrogenase-like Zn-dependent alcohol dehydrogenase/glycosyltransferase involved in cell wall biosynthesis
MSHPNTPLLEAHQGTEPIPETSVVIRAFNEERWLPDLLAALARQRYRRFEVLVVDSGSVDRTRDIAAASGARIVRLRSEDFTFGYSLNIGIEQARGAFIAIVSAHAIPTDENWLQRLIEPLRETGNAMVFGGQRGHAVSKFSEARDFERIFHSKPMVMDDDHVFVNNANSAVRKDLWERHRFDEGLPGLEDAEWAKYWIPRGFNVLYEPSACVYHVHTETWAQVRHRFHREGIAGRWTAVRIIRDIPGEISREIWWALKDFALALGHRKLASLAGEIARYRYNKAVGIIKGILDSRLITNPSKRAELYSDSGFSAVVVRGPHSAAIELRSIPKLKPSEVLVRVAYVGVCAADIGLFEGRLGQHGGAGHAGTAAKYPIVPGHELAGTVVSLGKKVTDLKEGDRVVVERVQGCGTCAECRRDAAVACPERREVGLLAADGGYAEYFVTRARYALRIPEQLSLMQAALTEPTAAVIKGLKRLAAAGCGDGPKRAAVIGAGAEGHLAAKLLAQRGHEVVAFDRQPAKLESLRAVVATERDLNGLDRFDWVVETTGDAGSVRAALQQSRRGATVLLLGLQPELQEFDFRQLVDLDKTVVGSAGSSRKDFDEALSALQHLDVAPLLQCRFPLEGFRLAWDELRSAAPVKVMLNIDVRAA